MNNKNIQANTQGKLTRFLILTNVNDCRVKDKSLDLTDSLNKWLSVIVSSGKPAVIQKYKDALLTNLSEIIERENVDEIYLCTASKRITNQERVGFIHLIRKIGKSGKFLPCPTKMHRERG
jgi:hypothetical protein